MNIVLIGYRGTGKSAVGKIVASRLGHALVSTDAEIVKLAGHSIPEIVEKNGWDYFRDIESNVCQDLAGMDGLVIDTGGGAILRTQNVVSLRGRGRLFWLTASVETIAKRISSETHRPSLTGTKSFVDEIQEVLSERTPKYQAAADYIIKTDGRSLAQVADDILATL